MIWSNTAVYKVLLLLHLASVVVGFGPYFLNGLLGRSAAKESPEGGRAITTASLQVSTVSQYAIYGVFIFGAGLIGSSNKNVTFTQVWVPISVVLWIATVGVLHGLILPAQRKLRDASGDRASLTQTLSAAFGVMNLIVVVALVLMVWEPGGRLP